MMRWQLKFALRGFWIGALAFVIGVALFANARPTTLQREAGLVLMLAAVPIALLVVAVSVCRRSSAARRQARMARRSVPSAGGHPRPGARPPVRPAAASRPIRRAVAPRRAANSAAA
jgi:hypothetical protein